MTAKGSEAAGFLLLSTASPRVGRILDTFTPHRVHSYPLSRGWVLVRPAPRGGSRSRSGSSDFNCVSGAAGAARATAGAAVGDRRLGRLHARNAADAAARVGRRARVVQAGYRGAVIGEPGRRAQVEELLDGQLAVEDVAADQAVVVIHVVGAD